MNITEIENTKIADGIARAWLSKIDKVDLLLDAVVQLADQADADCGNTQRSSNWLMIIAAAVKHAQDLLYEINAPGEAGLILSATIQVAEDADSDCGDVERSSNWLLMISAAVRHAQGLLQKIEAPTISEQESAL